MSLGGAKQRALLAILLLHANEAVSRDRLIEAVWGEAPPPSAAGSLDTYVYRLRKLLGPERLARRAGGYVLHVEPGELDVDQFDRLLTSAAGMSEASDCADAAAIFVDALALWRGPALADVLYEPFAADCARQLDERRLGAIEQRIETELGMGRDKELVLELKQLVREHPLRERLLASLMLALYRSGRQADALAAFREARVRLVEQLGLEPGPETRELERRILQHDPTLAAKRHTARTGPRPNRLRVPVAAGLGLMALLIVGSVLLGSRTASARHTLAPRQNGLVAVDTRSGQVVAASALDGTPDAVTAAAGSVWVADPGAEAVSRRDPETGAQIDLIPIGGEPGGIARGGGAIWVASTVGATIVRIDPTTESVTQRISLPGSRPAAITFGDGRVWVADSVARELFALDPSTGALQRTVGLDLQPSAIAVGRGTIWVAGYNDATVEELNPASGRLIARIRVGDGPAALAFQDGSLWVANSLDATVTRIDPATLATTATISVGNGPTALVASGGGGVWVAEG